MIEGSRVWRPYTQMKTAPPPLRVRAAQGVRIVLEDGRSLIDGVSSWWTAAHGHRHPAIVAAIEDQLHQLPHIMFGGLTHAPAEQLAQALADVLPADLGYAFLVESGSVSVEVAMKMAIQYAQHRGERGRTKFVSFLGGYHGDTFATMSVCDPEEGMHTGFRGALLNQHVVPLPDDPTAFSRFAEFLVEHRREVAAVLLEPLVQAAGGMRFHEPATVRAVRQACDAADVLLILDEIAVGFGRTGRRFACEHAGVVPDIITVGKALTGGTLPLAAAVARPFIFEAFLTDRADDALMHGPTYMANPLACRAALASLELFAQQPRLAQVAAIEAQLRRELAPCRSMPGVVDVRVLGAIGVVEMARIDDLEGLRRRFVDHGVWVRPLGRAIYLMPPFVISPDDLTTLTSAVQAVVAELASH